MLSAKDVGICRVLNKHRTCKCAEQRSIKILGNKVLGVEVTVVVGRAEHGALCLDILAPLLGLYIEALLEGVAELHIEGVGDAELDLRGDATDACARSVAACLIDKVVALLVVLLASIFKREYIVEHGVEALHEEVGLQATERVVVVCRCAERVRELGAQVGVYLDDGYRVVEGAHMQVLVICLWRAVTA